jgi:Trypsin/PEP-CTERM motif
MPRFSRLAVAATACLLGTAALASEPYDGNVVTGSSNGMSWKAQSLLTGFQLGPFNGTGTATNAGNSTYLPSYPAYSGVVGMFMNFNAATPTAGFVCTGTLLPDRMSILTAAHCVSDGAGTANPLSTTVFFQPPAGLAGATSIYSSGVAGVVGNPAATAITVSQYFVNSGYTGEVIDQNDIAVLRLSQAAPIWAVSHDIYTGGGLEGQQFNVAGYGRLGSGAGTYTPPNGASTTGRLRQGDNVYDYRWGDAAFGGFFTDRDASGENFFGKAEVAFSYVSDFDSGLAANNLSRNIALALGANLPSSTGLGNREVGVAGGDSGGPNFIDGLISGVNSYGLTFGANFGDVDGDLNSSFGEYSGYVPTFIHADFIRSSMVAAIPEPGTYALMALGLLGLGAVARRRKA